MNVCNFNCHLYRSSKSYAITVCPYASYQPSFYCGFKNTVSFTRNALHVGRLHQRFTKVLINLFVASEIFAVIIRGK